MRDRSPLLRRKCQLAFEIGGPLPAATEGNGDGLRFEAGNDQRTQTAVYVTSYAIHRSGGAALPGTLQRGTCRGCRYPRQGTIEGPVTDLNKPPFSVVPFSLS